MSEMVSAINESNNHGVSISGFNSRLSLAEIRFLMRDMHTDKVYSGPGVGVSLKQTHL